VHVHPAHFAGLDVLLLDLRHGQQRELATGGALKVRHFVDHDGGVGAAFGPRAEDVLRAGLRGGAQPRNRYRNDAPHHSPVRVQIAIVPHPVAPRRKSGGVSAMVR